MDSIKRFNRKKGLFLLYTKDKSKYSKLISSLEHELWRIEWIQDLATLSTHISKDSEQHEHICLTLFRPLPKRRLGEMDLISIESLVKNEQLKVSFWVNGSEDEKALLDDRLNMVLMKYGVRFRKDLVISTGIQQHQGRLSSSLLAHPKEVKMKAPDFIANRGLSHALEVHHHTQSSKEPKTQTQTTTKGTPMILYPRGCTLQLLDNKLSCVMMISSKEGCLPKEQAICTFSLSDQQPRLIAFGSSEMFTNEYIDQENNCSLMNCFFDFLLTNKNSPASISINLSDARTLELAKPIYGPNIDSIVQIPMLPMLGSSSKKNRQRKNDHYDASELFQERLFNLDNSMLPKLIEISRELEVNRGPLTLIKPHFDVQSLTLEPAHGDFILRELL